LKNGILFRIEIEAMKLIIQIPCYNEEGTIENTIRDLPSTIPGIDQIEYLVVDDGSTDNTVKIAEQAGVHHVLKLGTNRGLAKAFSSGMIYALSLGADILVNTDGDNQYCGADIIKLVQPIIESKADIVVGCRPIMNHPEFNISKKILQVFGSWTLRLISKTKVRDAASGFRAFSREACQRLFIHSNFSYCMETLIQAGNTGMCVSSVDIRINPKTRKSRLFKNIFQYIYKSSSSILSMFFLYRPGSFFFTFSQIFFAAAFFLGIRYIYLIYFTSSIDTSRTYLPSLILLVILAVMGMLVLLLGLIGEQAQAQRRLLEEIISNQRAQLHNNCKSDNKESETNE